MMHVRWAGVAIALTLACPAATRAQTAPSEPYQAVLLPASAKSADDFFKIEVATGQTWVHCCTNNNSSFSPIKDTTKIDPGVYSLKGWSHIEADGARSWELYRFDAKTGKTWVLTGGGSAPYGWAPLDQVN